jgi:hypothetical protein
MANIIQTEHGNYVIKAGKLGGACVARAFPKPPSKNKGVIAEAKGKNEQEAIDMLKAQIDDSIMKREETRRWDEGAGIAVPLADEYEEALRQTHLSAAQVAMLKLHALAGEDGMTLKDLAEAAGYQSTQAGTSLYGKAARAVAQFLRVDVPSAPNRPTGEPTAILARRLVDDDDAADDDAPAWVMHPEVRAAVEAVL